MTKDVSVRRSSRPWYRPSLTTQIMIGLIVGVAVGWIRPEWGNNVYFLRDIFLNLIKSIIGPLVFSTLVVGIAGRRRSTEGGTDGRESARLLRSCHHRRIIHWPGGRQFNQAGNGGPACDGGE